MYTPSGDQWSNSIVATSTYRIKITTLDANVPEEIGFKAPDTPGDYQFDVEFYRYLSTGAPQEYNEVWIHIPPKRLTEVGITSINKEENTYNVLTFKFTLTTLLNASDDPDDRGVIYIEFPRSAWQQGLGHNTSYAPDNTALVDGGAIDCPIILAGHFDTTALTCTYDEQDTDNYRVKITGWTSAIFAGSTFNFQLLVVNPAVTSPALYDLIITIKTFHENVTNLIDPTWTPLDETIVDFIETVRDMSVTPTNPTGADIHSVDDGTVQATGTKIDLEISNAGNLSDLNSMILRIGPLVTLPTITACDFAGADCSVHVTPFPNLNMVYFTSITATLNTAQQLDITGFTNPISVRSSYPGWQLTFINADRNIAEIITYDGANFQTLFTVAKTCTLGANGSSNAASIDFSTLGGGQRYEGYTEWYSIRFNCPHKVPAGGRLQLRFDNSKFEPISETCMWGPSQVNQNLDKIRCTSDTDDIFIDPTEELDITTQAEIQIMLKNTATAGGGDTEDLFIYTYEVTPSTYPIDSGDNNNADGDDKIAIPGTVAAPNATTMTKFEAGSLGTGLNYHEEQFVRHGAGNDKKGPLVFQIETG